MDSFSYNNIFETKGIEYLAIIAFFAILVPFWIMLNKEVRVSGHIKKLGRLTLKALRIPQGLLFSKNHTWTHLEKSGLAQVGVDDLLLHITGEVSFKYLKEPGDMIKKGDLLAEIESNGKLLKISSPVSGEITDTNSILGKTPGVLNEDPYLNGWMYKVKPSGWTSETSSYYLAEEATSWAAKELVRFKDFIAASAGKYSPEVSKVVLQDGGEMVDHTLSELPEDVWIDFQKNFLT
jgi:glycine cleavage system H protein